MSDTGSEIMREKGGGRWPMILPAVVDGFFGNHK